jgi:signal transduction histidine kinase
MAGAPGGNEIAVAWNAECLKRERRENTFAILCTAILIPLWVGFDLLLEPGLVRPFLLLRGLAAAVAWLLLVALRRVTTLTEVRAIMFADTLLTGPFIAVMLPRVQHFNPYLFGFSLFFWAAGALLSWPLRYAVASFAWQLAAVAAALVAWPGVRDSADLVAAGFYLATAAIISSGMTYARRRPLRLAFEASFALEARNIELASAIAQLHEAQAKLVESEKLSSLGRLLAGLSHEINNPVNVLHNNLEPVRGYLDGLVEVGRLATSGRAEDLSRARERAAELDLEFVARDLAEATDTMRGALDRIRQIHRDLRAFIRGDSPDRVLGDVNEGLRATVALVTRRAAPNVQVELALEDLPQVNFQPGQLDQVWHNLLQNALEAVGARGRITVRSRSDGRFVEVAIADDGPGVLPAHQSRLFEPFFTTKEVGKGTGLGLATSYQIVSRQGGTLALDSEHAPGARFVVRLPVAPTGVAVGAV